MDPITKFGVKTKFSQNRQKEPPVQHIECLTDINSDCNIPTKTLNLNEFEMARTDHHVFVLSVLNWSSLGCMITISALRFEAQKVALKNFNFILETLLLEDGNPTWLLLQYSMYECMLWYAMYFTIGHLLILTPTKSVY